MSIKYVKDKKRFVINTKSSTYAFEVVLDHYLYHLYYGKRTADIPDHTFNTISFAPYLDGYSESRSPDAFPLEISFFGSGDFRPNSLKLSSDGTGVCDFVYRSYRIFNGRSSLDGLPFSRAQKGTKTLEITLVDDAADCVLRLYYTVFAELDVITRYMTVENRGKNEVRIEKCMPLTLDLRRCDLDMISFYGAHCDEMKYQRHPLHHGTQSVYSNRGATSHMYNPLTFICDRGANERSGQVYGFNFVYSGSFLNEVDVDQQNRTRIQIGLGSETFAYTVFPKEKFVSPEAIMTYSPSGIGRVTANMHKFVLNSIMPPVSLEAHPVVLNTWEACYFDIDEEKLVRFASEAKKTGFDMLVMDDGWFGKRNNDRAGLGDWFENREKFPDGLNSFVKRIKAEGVKFGIWVEPEMVNPDSDLYRAHPEWALRVNGREPLRSRNQLVLDMSNPEVVDYLISLFDKTFDGIDIDYFKWDMNRHMSNVGSPTLPPHRQKEVFFRYMKGVYRLLSWFGQRFPNAVIETCSGGGGRYDLGMMQYGIQIWTSDHTDPYARTMIQSSAIMGYPAATMSCHVSDPHESMASLDYRYKVAAGGMLGYELNILNMSDEIKAEISRQIKEYKTFEHIIRLGDYHSLVHPATNDYAAYYFSNTDGTELLLTVIEKSGCKKGQTKRLKLTAANASLTYTDTRTGISYSGAELKAGIRLDLCGEPDSAQLYFFKTK